MPVAGSSPRVVFLVNFLAPNLREVLREVRSRLGNLTILVSVPMESNRQFEVDLGGLDVRVQKTKTVRQFSRHPGGYVEELYIHVPLDTFSQLRTLKPDCIVSLEMGSRSLHANLYRQLHRRTRHVLAVYGSERSEAGRGFVRNALRRSLVRMADRVTFNGPSCRRYLEALGTNPRRMLPWDYAADPEKIYRGPLVPSQSGVLRFLTIGQWIERKGVLEAARMLNEWASQHPERILEWSLVGGGPLESPLKGFAYRENLKVDLLGHRDPSVLRELYREHDCLLFPTLGDEWGLVVDEALASGLSVIGSVHSQAVETLIRDGVNGWRFDPEQPASLGPAIDTWGGLDAAQRMALRETARASVNHRTPAASAEQFVAAIHAALDER